jgi:hypothetical protein
VATNPEALAAQRESNAAILCGSVPPIGKAPNDNNAWLTQAMRLRDRAFRLAQDSLVTGVEHARRQKGCIDPSTVASEVEYAAILTADYLVESETMVDLMGDLAQKGLLASPFK